MDNLLICAHWLQLSLVESVFFNSSFNSYVVPGIQYPLSYPHPRVLFEGSIEDHPDRRQFLIHSVVLYACERMHKTVEGSDQSMH